MARWRLWGGHCPHHCWRFSQLLRTCQVLPFHCFVSRYGVATVVTTNLLRPNHLHGATQGVRVQSGLEPGWSYAWTLAPPPSLLMLLPTLTFHDSSGQRVILGPLFWETIIGSFPECVYLGIHWTLLRFRCRKEVLANPWLESLPGSSTSLLLFDHGWKYVYIIL